MNIRTGICSMEGIDWIDFIESVSGKGFEHIELRVDNVDKESYIFNRDYLQQVKYIAGAKGFTLSIHSLVGTNLGEKVNRIRNASADIICDVMEAGEFLGALWVATHIGSGGFSNRDVNKKFSRLDCAINGIENILQRTAGYTIKLALENLPRYPPERGQCRLGDCAAEFQYILRNINSESLRVLFDVAHARVNAEAAEDVRGFIKAVENSIIGFHMHWNDGSNDGHWPLRQENVDEMKTYLSGSTRVFTEGVPVLFECYQLEENIECLRLLQLSKETMVYHEKPGIYECGTR